MLYSYPLSLLFGYYCAKAIYNYVHFIPWYFTELFNLLHFVHVGFGFSLITLF